MYINLLSLSYHKVVAIVAIVALLMWSFGFPSWVRPSEAANLTWISDTISDSDSAVSADHTIVFTTPTLVDDAADRDIVVSFPAQFNVSTSTAILYIADFDVATTGEYTLGADCTGSEHMSVATGTPTAQDITFTICTGDGGDFLANGTTTIEIGTVATAAGAGVNQIINPTPIQSYEITVATPSDDGATRVAIIDDVVVTASVTTSLTFIVYGLAAGATVNTSPTTTADATTPTTLPFGDLVVGTSKTLAQSLSVATNARNGYTVTANQNQNLLSSTGADIDRFIDDLGTSVPVAWVPPTGTLGNEVEYGHMGITTEDVSLAGGNDFGDDLWAGNFVNNPREVLYHDGPSDGIQANTGSTTVGYQAEIMAFQEAGTDYTAVITYVATPIF